MKSSSQSTPFACGWFLSRASQLLPAICSTGHPSSEFVGPRRHEAMSVCTLRHRAVDKRLLEEGIQEAVLPGSFFSPCSLGLGILVPACSLEPENTAWSRACRLLPHRLLVCPIEGSVDWTWEPVA